MQLILEVSEDLWTELQGIADKNLLSIEHTATVALSTYVIQQRARQPNPIVPDLMMVIGQALINVAEQFVGKQQQQEE